MAQYEKRDAVFDKTRPHPRRIFLFDVDGTLTEARKKITPDMKAYLEELRKKVTPHRPSPASRETTCLTSALPAVCCSAHSIRRRAVWRASVSSTASASWEARTW
jgi:hypothetical protein